MQTWFEVRVERQLTDALGLEVGARYLRQDRTRGLGAGDFENWIGSIGLVYELGRYEL